MDKPKRPKRHRRVKQLNTSFKLLGVGLQVLEKFGAGSTATETAKALGCTKANITYWKNKLLDIGAIRLQTSDVIKIYSLTPYGSKLLTRSERGLVEPVVLEDCAVKFEIVEGEKCRVDWRKLGSPRNWEKLGVRIGDVRVVRTSRSIIIHPGKLHGFDVDELEVEAGRIVERVKTIVETRFGMVLSDEGVPLHKPIYRFYSEEAKEDVKNGTCIIEGQSSTDNSPPEKIPHEEYTGKQRAKARQLLPDTVKRIESKVDDLNNNLASLATSLEKLTDIIGKLGQAPVPEKPLSENEVDKYVR